jgi:signal peptidase I
MLAVLFALSPFALVAAVLFAAFHEQLFPIVAITLCLFVLIRLVEIVWACILARSRGEQYRLAWCNRLLVYAAFVVIIQISFEVGAKFLRRQVLEPFRIPSQSMAPTLLAGDQLFVVKKGRLSRWGRGDVVVFHRPDADSTKTFIGRVIGLGGDTVEVGDREVWVNGQLLRQEPCKSTKYTYISSSEGTDVPTTADCAVEAMAAKTYNVLHLSMPEHRADHAGRVEPNHVFIMGDNRDNSWDSRFYGAIPEDQVFGRAHVIWFSYASHSGIRWDRVGQLL